MPKASLSAGDFVIERLNPGGHLAPVDPAMAKRFNRRTGRVVEITTHRNKTGGRISYAHVIWDGLRSPSLHAVSRLERYASLENS